MWKGRLWIIITLCLSYCLLKKISHDPIDKRKNRLMEYKPLHQRFNCQIKKRKEKHMHNDIFVIKTSNYHNQIGESEGNDLSLLEYNQTRLPNIFINRTKSNARAHTPLISKKRGSTAISLTRTPEGEKGQKKSLVYIIVQR